MSNGHAFLPPSGASAWSKCAMWPIMNARFPQGDTDATREGTAAHWVAWEMLEGREPAEGSDVPDGLGVVTREMLDGGDLLVGVVREMLTLRGLNVAALNVEQKTKTPIHDLCEGTPDIWTFDPIGWQLDVIDYKFGHRFVDEFENEQLITYFSGILEKLALLKRQPAAVIDEHIRVNFTIIQPRCYYRGSPVRTWSVLASTLRAHVNKLKFAAERATGVEPEAVTNPACVECPGRHACPTLQRAAYSDAESAGCGDIVELDPESASLELYFLERAQNRLESRITGLQEYLLLKIKSGSRAPFHRLEQSAGRPNWSMPVEQVIAMGQLMNVDLSKTGVVTPGQAKKAGISEDLIKAYSITTPGSIKLAPDNPANARRVFGSFQNER